MPSSGNVAVLVCFLTVINIKSDVGRGLILFYNIQSIMKGVRVGIEAETLEECFLKACFLPFSGSGITQDGLLITASIINQENAWAGEMVQWLRAQNALTHMAAHNCLEF